MNIINSVGKTFLLIRPRYELEITDNGSQYVCLSINPGTRLDFCHKVPYHRPIEKLGVIGSLISDSIRKIMGVRHPKMCYFYMQPNTGSYTTSEAYSWFYRYTFG